MDEVTPDAAPMPHRLPLGDRWYRIRLDAHAEADVKTYLDVMFDGVPADDAAPTRGRLETRFSAQILAGRQRHGIDFHIPAPRHGNGPLPALTVMTAQIPVPATAAREPSDAVARIASANPAARTGVIAGMPAVRIDHTADPEALPPQVRDAPGLRHVEYLLPFAGDPQRRWLSIALTAQLTPTHGQDETDSAVTAFDQAVAELAWG